MKKIGKTIEKKMTDFQNKNMAAFQEANAKQDTATVNKIMNEAIKIQSAYTDHMIKYASEHPKSFISALIVESMFKMPKSDPKKIKELHEKLDDDLKGLKSGKNIKKQLDALAKIATIEQSLANVK